MKKKICFVTISSSPEYLGGYSLYHKNLIKFFRDKENIKISWVYFGKENNKYIEDNVNYIEKRTNKIREFTWFLDSLWISIFFRRNKFDIINPTIGLSNLFYRKKKNQRIIQTFHGTSYYFNKNHFKRFNIIQKIIFSPLLFFSWLQEKPHKETDKIICVSEKVKRQVKKIYGDRFKIEVLRTGVDLTDFKPRNKNKTRTKLNLDTNKLYGLYVGRGGYWTKGLDRLVNLGREIYLRNKEFRLIVIGPDFHKVKHLLSEEFIIFKGKIPREEMPLYYSSSDMFFCMSRYEGGAPTLVVSEAMASGCLLICSEDSEQEIVQNKKDALIINSFGGNEAEMILNTYKDKELMKRIIKNSMSKIKEFSLNSWAKKYLEILLK